MRWYLALDNDPGETSWSPRVCPRGQKVELQKGRVSDCCFYPGDEKDHRYTNLLGLHFGGVVETGLAQLRGAWNVGSQVNLPHNLLHLATPCGAHVDFAGDIGCKGIAIMNPLEARHFFFCLVMGRSPVLLRRWPCNLMLRN